MQQRTDATTPRKAGRIFYFTTVTLLLGAVVVALIQKDRESAVAMLAARRVAAGTEATDEFKSNVQHTIRDAEHWGMLSLVVVSLAILSWGIAIWRREKHRSARFCVVVFLSLYVLLQLIMV